VTHRYFVGRALLMTSQK